MTRVHFQVSSEEAIVVDCDPSGTLLEGLLAAGISVPNSCRAGLCQACLCQANQGIGKLNPEAQAGLSDLQLRNNLLLACQAKPVEGLSISLPVHDNDWVCELEDKRYLSPAVVELCFRAEGQWRAGQHLLLWMNDEQARPYSASNHDAGNGLIRFFVERHPHGDVSRWCYDELKVGEKVRLSEPQGHFHCGTEMGAGVALFAEGSGLGPAVGIMQSVQAVDPTLKCDLFFVHSERSAEEGERFCEAISKEFELNSAVRFHFPEVAGAMGSLGYSSIQKQLKAEALDLRGKKTFIVGSAAFVSEMSRACFFAGAARNDIVTEIFVSQESS